MLFSGDEVEKKLASLSGGEAARLIFARLSVEQPNVLVLDEPTNHLDLEAIEALVAGLEAYDGTLIFVSHDRWFVSQLATRVFEITERGINDFPGTYDEYLGKLRRRPPRRRRRRPARQTTEEGREHPGPGKLLPRNRQATPASARASSSGATS